MDILKTAADKQLDEVVDVAQAGAGMSTFGWLKTWTSDRDACDAVRARGLETVALSSSPSRYRRPPELILGFAGCNRALDACGKQFVVVPDSGPIIQRVMTAILQCPGFAVSATSDINVLLHLPKECDPDLVFTEDSLQGGQWTQSHAAH